MSAAPAGEPVAPRVPTWTFADRMRKVRRDTLAMEQAEMAVELGVTKAAYAAWESGRNEPRSILAVAKRVEAMSGVPASWILGIDDPFRAIAPQTPSNSRVTGVGTGGYPPASAATARRLSLVSGPDDGYRCVTQGYGSCASGRGNANGRSDNPASEMVNDAHAA